MNEKKPYISYTPISIKQELDKILSKKEFNFKFDKIIVYRIIELILLKSEQEEEFVNLKINYLIKKFGKKIENYIKFLIEEKLIICDNRYIIGLKAKGYKINEKFLKKDELIKIKIIPETKQYKRISSEIKKEKNKYKKQSTDLKLMCRAFMNLELDVEKCNNYIDNLYYKDKSLEKNNEIKASLRISVNNFIDKRKRYFKRNKTNNRLDSNLTCLKKELREFLIGDFCETDLSNSQPVFLASEMNNDFSSITKEFGKTTSNKIKKIIEQENFKAEGEKFLKLTADGTLYDEFIEKFLKNKQINYNQARKLTKKIFFQVFYSKNFKRNGKILFKTNKQIFSKKFPLIYKIISTLKENKYQKFSIFLQKKESNMFIDIICKELIQNNIIPLTIHDSIIVKKEEQEKTLEIIKTVFYNNSKINPTFKSNYFAN